MGVITISMGVITISREYGSDGHTVARKAADRLGYLCMDKELIVEVARQAQVPVSEVERFDEQPEHPALRVLRKFLTPGYPDALTGLSEYEWWATVTVPEFTGRGDRTLSVLDEEAYVKLTQDVILRLANRGNVVLVGRGSQALLTGRSNVLHARIVAPVDYRIRTTMERDGLERQDAARRMQKVDEQRKRYVKRHYGINRNVPQHYHLTVNTAQIGVEGAADIVVEATRHLPMERGYYPQG